MVQLVSALCLAFATVNPAVPSQQLSIPRVNLLPDCPATFQMRDWRATATAFDQLVFDQTAKGTYLPLIWDAPGAGPGERNFGLPSYVGSEDKRGKSGEALAVLGSLLGGAMVGRHHPELLLMASAYQNRSEGVVVNDVGGKTGSSFWYELFPSILYAQLSVSHPNWAAGRVHSRQTAEAWRRGIRGLNGNFDHTSYSLTTQTPVDNHDWQEPDSAAAIAYLELMEGLRSGKPEFLSASREALRALAKRDTNPNYEILTPFGVVAAAYLNAERGEQWPVPRMLEWCFDPTSPNRIGWGMITGTWGGYDVGGLMGSTNDGGGYAFAMNSFVSAAALAPVARYDDRYSAALAKWILNLTSSARLFYSDSLPADHQSSADWKGDPQHGIAYEGLRRSWMGKSPFAAGDARRSGWAKTDFALYGGAYAGLLAALVHQTNVKNILRIDLRATDFLPAKAYPTDLYWNPNSATARVRVPLGDRPVRLYDAVANRFLSSVPIKGPYELTIRPKQAVQLVQVPSEGTVSHLKNRTLVQGVMIDGNNGRVPLPARIIPPRKDESVQIRAVRTEMGIPADWSRSDAIALSGGEGSSMHAELRFAYSPSALHFQLKQVNAATATLEAPTSEELERHWWDFEAVVLNFDLSHDGTPVATVPELTVGWNSTGSANLAFSPDLSAFTTSSHGTASANDRVVEGTIPWSALLKVTGLRQRPRLFGCQPLLVDGTFKRQAYIGGARYRRPNGFDRNSRTIVLEER